VQGFAELQRASARVEDGIGPEVRRRLKAIGEKVALVAAADAPRGATGELQQSIRVSVTQRTASIYSTAEYGGAQNFGAWSKGRGPHISRKNASHYMDRAVRDLEPWVRSEIDGLTDWLVKTYEE